MISTLTENPQRLNVELPITPASACDSACCSTPRDSDVSPALGHKLRSGVMFVLACIFSPCCAPLLVAVALALLAGSPLAAWIGTNLGWVYGGLTLVSIVSLVLGIRWLRR
jgi:hypothetical protein